MKLVYVFAVLSLLLAACTQKTTTDVNEPFAGGTDGLSMSFIPNAPPRSIIDGGQLPFSVSVMIDNLGESSVGQGTDNSFGVVSLLGINPDQFGNPDMVKTFDQESFSLQGAQKNINGDIIKGGQDALTFDNFLYTPVETGQSTVTLRADICYDYSTLSNTKICIKDNVVENVQDNSICTLSGPKDPKNSGAPVHVTTMDEAPMGKNKIGVTFTIENLGKGMVFRRASQSIGIPEDLCNPNNLRDGNVVHVRVYTGDSAMTSLIQCPLLHNDNEGDVMLPQGTAQQVSCTLQTSPSGNRVYTDTLHVDLTYTYLDYIETPILIQHSAINNP